MARVEAMSNRTESEKHQIVEGLAISLEEHATVDRRPATEEIFFRKAVEHLRLSQELEQSGKERAEVFAEAAISIILAVASSEIYINQVIIDLNRQEPAVKLRRLKSAKSVAKFDEWYRSVFSGQSRRRPSLKDKFKVMKSLLSEDKYDDRTEPLKPFICAIKTRNDLVHMKQEWNKGDFDSQGIWVPDLFKEVTATRAREVVSAIQMLIKDFHPLVSRELPTTFNVDL
jgi:hypothetical protein